MYSLPGNTSQTFPIDLIRRMRREYLELPGLSLTCAQARRLWGGDRGDCAVALKTLESTGFLSRTDDGRYVRARAGSLWDAIQSRDAPWDCRWADPVLASPAPLWLDAFSRRWTCLRDGGPGALDVQRCFACPRWEPRLVTRSRVWRSRNTASGAGRSPAEFSNEDLDAAAGPERRPPRRKS
jgi:hypothetical protein